MPSKPKTISWKRLESRAERIVRQAANDHVQKIYVPDAWVFWAKIGSLVAAAFLVLWVFPHWAYMTVLRAEAYCKQPEPLTSAAFCLDDTVCMHGKYLIVSGDPHSRWEQQTDLCGGKHVYLRLLDSNAGSQPEPMVPEGDEKETTNERFVTAHREVF